MTQAPGAGKDLPLMQIGDVAGRTGLSLRTIRHYEEVGLLPETQRTQGGFRLYTEEAVQRLLLIMHMKPLDFTLEEMREMIEIRDELAAPGLVDGRHAELLTQLASYARLVDAKLAKLQKKVSNAQIFAAELRDQIGASAAG